MAEIVMTTDPLTGQQIIKLVQSIRDPSTGETKQVVSTLPSDMNTIAQLQSNGFTQALIQKTGGTIVQTQLNGIKRNINNYLK